MVKLKPEERWNRMLLERFEAFRLSGELKRLRDKGLRALGRRRRLTSLEYWKLPLTGGPLDYMAWDKECEKVAKHFGLAPWTVKMACLLRDYDPVKSPFPIGANWPSIRIITTHKDPIFLKQLFYHVRELGVPVYVQGSGHKTAPIFLDYEFIPSPLPDSHKPSIHDVFTVELEFPPIFPPEARQQIVKDTDDIKRELLKRLGYRVPKRLRTTNLISKASSLRLNKSRLAKRELYEIVAETSEYATDEEDEQRRKTVKSRRHFLKQRLIKPYKAEES